MDQCTEPRGEIPAPEAFSSHHHHSLRGRVAVAASGRRTRMLPVMCKAWMPIDRSTSYLQSPAYSNTVVGDASLPLRLAFSLKKITSAWFFSSSGEQRRMVGTRLRRRIDGVATGTSTGGRSNQYCAYSGVSERITSRVQCGNGLPKRKTKLPGERVRVRAAAWHLIAAAFLPHRRPQAPNVTSTLDKARMQVPRS